MASLQVVFWVTFVAVLAVPVIVKWFGVKKPDDRRPKSFDELAAMQREQSAYDARFEVPLMIVTAIATAIFLILSVINGDWN